MPARSRSSLVLVRVAADDGLIALGDDEARVQQPMAEGTVVGQQQKPGRVEVETTYGHGAWVEVGQKVKDMWVGHVGRCG